MLPLMNRPRVTAEEYINFLVATPRQATATEAARCQPAVPGRASHDAFTRLLDRLEPDADELWREVQSQIQRDDGYLIVDDSVLDKPYARRMDLVGYLWSGKHQRAVKGIGLVTLLWTDGDRHLPCDYRLYDAADGLTKNDHFRALLETANARGFRPKLVLFDSWYAGLENLKQVRKFGWHWLTRLKYNRKVNLDKTGLRPVSEVAIAPTGTIVHLEGYGLVKVFLIEAQDGNKGYWATNQLEMTDLGRLQGAEVSWKIEEYHRGLKQFTHVERCQARTARAQRNHIGLCLRAFLRLEHYAHTTGIQWLSAKLEIARDAVRAYLANPRYQLTPATA